MPHSTFLVVRGVVSILIGLAALFWPGVTLLALVVLFAAYAFLDGLVNLIIGLARTPTRGRSWTQVVLGIIGVVAAVVAIAFPHVTLLWLILFIAAWAIVRGVLDIVVAVRLRHVIHNEWLLGLAGVLSILFGIAAIAYPLAGALTIAWLLAAYALAWGVVLITVAFRVRRPVPA